MESSEYEIISYVVRYGSPGGSNISRLCLGTPSEPTRRITCNKFQVRDLLARWNYSNSNLVAFSDFTPRSSASSPFDVRVIWCDRRLYARAPTYSHVKICCLELPRKYNHSPAALVCGILQPLHPHAQLVNHASDIAHSNTSSLIHTLRKQVTFATATVCSWRLHRPISYWNGSDSSATMNSSTM